MCLAGENGAGKSTLIKILTGAIKRDSGEYLIDGEDIGSPTPAQARDGRHRRRLPGAQPAARPVGRREPADGPPAGPPRHHPPGRAAHARRRRCSSASASTGSTRAREVATLSLATQQLVEIAKVLGASPRVLIFDEPTTALSESRDEGAARADPPAPRRGPRRDVRDPPPRGDVRDRRPRHGPARRRPRHEPADERLRPGLADRLDGGPQDRVAVPGDRTARSASRG